MEKNKIQKIIYIFLILQPIIDLATALMTRFLNCTITVGIITRGLFLMFLVIYNIFFVKSENSKKTIIYLLSVFIFMITYFILKPDIFKMSFLKTEIIYMFKYFYFPIVGICLINCYKHLGFEKEKLFKIFLYNALVMSILVIVPYITNTSFSSYHEISQGTVGWFYAANEVGAIMVALFPFLYYLLYEREEIIKTSIIFIIAVLAMTLLGTKTSFLGMLITEVVFALYFLLYRKNNRAYGLKVSIALIIISFVLIPNISAVRNLQNSIAKSNAIIEQKNKEKDKISNKDTDRKHYDNNKIEKIMNVALSGRDDFFFKTMSIYEKSSLEDKMFGIGFVNRESINNKKIEKLIEIDPLDIYFHYGIIGFIIYFSPLIGIVYIAFKTIIKDRFKLSFFKLTSIYALAIVTMISMVAGHVYSAPAVSIYAAFMMAILSNTKIELISNKASQEKKKITILALHLGFGGVEKYISSLCKMFENEYEVEIISTYKVLDKPAFSFSDKVNIIYLIEDAPNKNELKQAIKSKNIINIFKEGFKSLKILYLKRSRNIKSIRNIRSDYIITTRTFHSLLVGYYAYSNISKIATEHNFHNDNKKYINKVINSIKDFNYFIVVSENLKKIYENKIGKTKCLYIPNVIDKLPQKRSALTNKNIITIGRLSPEKGQKDLIDVFKIVNKELSKTKLYIVGDGPLKEELKKYTQKLELTDKIVFTGFLDDKEKEKYIFDSSLFVLPSYTESFGLVLIEAMSYGLPCIAFDSSNGAKELLKNNVGILIKDRNKENMAKEIIKELKNEKKDNYSEKGYKYCQKYLIDNVKKDWFSLLS